MDNFKIKIIERKKIWEDFLLSKNPHSFLQSWGWGQVNIDLGKKVIRFGIYKNNELVGICQIIVERAKRGSYLLIPAGPLLNWEDGKSVKTMFAEITSIAKNEKVWFIRTRPELKADDKNVLVLKKLGFVPAPMHVHGENTLVLDIDKGEEQILSGMRKNTRYCIRKSLIENYKITITADPNDTKILEKLQEETVQRHKFIGFNPRIFTSQLENFGPENKCALFIVEKNKKKLAAAIVIFYGAYAYYHHSGSSESSRNTNASYFLQWEIIKEAKKRGCKYYDFWGIAPNDNPKHRFAGVTIFKKGFGGERLDWVHAHDKPVSPLYLATYIFESIRKVHRRL